MGDQLPHPGEPVQFSRAGVWRGFVRMAPLDAGPAGWTGAVVALIVGNVTGSLFAALAAGVAAVALLRLTSLG